ncbi:MAG TPA: methyl-accepting chemotaxis protein [Spirochaetota bacterium]|nr:methyl-accepting chemotaxis protein [Spirochaetota bacterium]
MKKSIIRNYLVFSILFGISMGVAFRIVTPFFVNFRSDNLNIIFSAMCLLAGIAVGLFSFLIGKLTLIRFIGGIEDYSSELAKGNFTNDFVIESDDDIGKFSTNFSSIIREIRKTIHSLTELSGELSTAMEEQSAASSTLSDNSQTQAEMQHNLMTAITRNAESLGKASSHVDALTSTFDSLLGRIEALSETINSVSEQSRKAIALSSSISSEIMLSEDSLRSSVEVMKRIGQTSEEMKSIIAIINDISDRINLLSLNASIESARAGEAGRGFAVVSEEISKLADQTSASMKNIDDLIRLSSEEIRKGGMSISATVENMNCMINDISAITSMIQSMNEHMNRQVSVNSDVTREAESVKTITTGISGIISDHRQSFVEMQKSVLDIGEASI